MIHGHAPAPKRSSSAATRSAPASTARPRVRTTTSAPAGGHGRRPARARDGSRRSSGRGDRFLRSAPGRTRHAQGVGSPVVLTARGCRGEHGVQRRMSRRARPVPCRRRRYDHERARLGPRRCSAAALNVSERRCLTVPAMSRASGRPCGAALRRVSFRAATWPKSSTRAPALLARSRSWNHASDSTIAGNGPAGGRR